MKKIKYLIFLSGQFDSKLPTVQDLVTSISKDLPVICFEYPRFYNLINVVTFRKKLLYSLSNNLIVYRSIGIFPYGRTIPIINFINHFANYIILNFILRLKDTDFKIITITPEVYYLLKFNKILKSDITYFVEENYTCLPFWSHKLQKKQFNELESKFLPYCKKVIVNSQPIFNKYVKLHDKVFLFLQPSNIFVYKKNRYIKDTVPEELKNIPKPIAGFIGSFYDWKVNISLFYETLCKYPKISFVVIGLTNISDQWKKRLGKKNNYFYLGHKSRNELPLFISLFDICLIPYSIKKAGYAFPTKIFEYLFYKKPVVSTALPSIKFLAQKSLIYWSINKQQFITNIKKALFEKYNYKTLNERKIEAEKNSWENRISELVYLINL